MNVISPLIQFQQQLRIFHWQTDSYAQHKAFGKTYEDMDGLIDSFVEIYMGNYGRNKPTTTFQIYLKPMTDFSVVDDVLGDFEFYLKNMEKEIPSNTDLLNIRDEMLAGLNKLRYLLSLK
jgi:hypothetical protein